MGIRAMITINGRSLRGNERNRYDGTQGTVSVIYGITDSDDVAVHIKKHLLLVPHIPDLEDYLKLTLDSFFRTARTLDIEMENCRFQECER